MWSDNETTEDLLGFQVHADLIHSIVIDRTMLPATIGIFGDWGSGKTSVMKMLEKTLNPDNYEKDPEKKSKYEKIACLFFNGWLFEGYDDAKSAILSSILLQLSEHQRFGPKIRDKAASLLKSVDYMRLARLGLKSTALPALMAYISGGATLVPGLVGMAGSLFNTENRESEDSNPAEPAANDEENDEKTDAEKMITAGKPPAGFLDVRSFRKQFSKLIDECDIDSLVVLIDDLDRCSPERIIDNLEAIKLFLNVERTAFIIGADPRIVRHAIATRYKPDEIQEQDDQEESADRLVLDYLEKLIQIPYHLPRLSPTEVETYMVLLFCFRDLEKEDAKKCLTSFHSLRNSNRYSPFRYPEVKEALGKQEVPVSLSQSLTFCATSAPLITEGLKGNPRQVKRFLNAFMLRKQLAAVSKLAHIREEVLVKLMVLEYGHPKEYRQLYNWQTQQDGFPKEIQDLESIILSSDEGAGSEDEEPDSEVNPEKKDNTQEIPPGWATPFMQTWIRMDPPLSEVDLRDYFWISRDRLQSTFSGISMVSPTVRQILEDLISEDPGKHNNAVEAVVPLQEDERESLLTQLEKHVYRHPDQEQGYDALVALIEKDINGSMETLASVLAECPPDSIPPEIAFPLRTLAEGKPGFNEVLQPVISQLEGTQSQIGKALQQTKADI